jgi:hypothetical protein
VTKSAGFVKAPRATRGESGEQPVPGAYGDD